MSNFAEILESKCLKIINKHLSEKVSSVSEYFREYIARITHSDFHLTYIKVPSLEFEFLDLFDPKKFDKTYIFSKFSEQYHKVYNQACGEPAIGLIFEGLRRNLYIFTNVILPDIAKIGPVLFLPETYCLTQFKIFVECIASD